ncbi:FecR domain-containing protein [Sulfurimonas sp.]|uniref:FecR family protein n=1 Tax=Sulfurimonas sp. TaxID=2022749 RepID=UPI0035664910
MSLFSKIILLVILISSTLFAKDVATITGLNGNAFVDRDGQKIELSLGDKLQEKDIILTKDKTKVQIIFKDETIISIGKNSTFAINEYLFEENQEPVAKFGMISGAMRAITGKIGKVAPDKFMVKTKTATMGIRGTNFSVLVGEDGSYQAYCTYGAISVTIKGSEFIVQQGFFISISPDGKVEQKEFTPEDLKEMKKKNFAKSKAKKGDGSEDGDSTASNDGQIDTTTEEQDNVFIKDITETVTDAKQTTDLASLISSYSMSDAQYTGNYTTTVDSGGDWGAAEGGTATLNVDFGNDVSSLVLNDGNNDFTVSGTTTIEGTSLKLIGNNGSDIVNGTFEGATGNKVTGDFSADVGGSGDEKGTYTVTTEQVLH